MTRKSAPNGLTTGAGGGYRQRRGGGRGHASATTGHASATTGDAGANTGNAGSGDPAYRGRLARRGGPTCEQETEVTTGSWQVVGIRSPPAWVSDSLHKTLDEWQPGFELVGFGDELLDALLANGERGVRKFARVFLGFHAFQQALQSVVSVGQARRQYRRHHFLEDFLRFESSLPVIAPVGVFAAHLNRMQRLELPSSDAGAGLAEVERFSDFVQRKRLGREVKQPVDLAHRGCQPEGLSRSAQQFSEFGSGFCQILHAEETVGILGTLRAGDFARVDDTGPQAGTQPKTSWLRSEFSKPHSVARKFLAN